MRQLTPLLVAILPILAGCNLPGTPTAPLPEPTLTASPGPETADLPEERILILEPGPGSRLVGSIPIAGVADPTFEQHLGVRILLDDGTLLASASATIQADWGQRGPFAVDVPFNLSGERSALIQVFDVSARDGGLIHLSSVGVILADSGPVDIRPVQPHPEAIRIASPVALVSGGRVHVEGVAVASFEQTLVVSLLDENGALLAQAPVIVEAPEYGMPGPFRADLSFSVQREQPGRVVVADPSPAFPGDVHLASIDVTIAP